MLLWGAMPFFTNGMNPWYPISIYKNILWLFIKQRLFRRGRDRRDEKLVVHDYTLSWTESISENVTGRRLRIHKLYGRLGLYRSIDYRKFFVKHIFHTIASLQPKNILELGSGNGINVLVMAVLYPTAQKIVGVELTEKGVETGREALKNPPIKELMYLTEESEETIRRRLKEVPIEFIKGDLTKLPFADKSFDFSFSLLVFEQMPGSYPEAFKEVRRVTAGHALFLEEFKEAQENIFQRVHLLNVDYFRASFWEVTKAGLKVLRFEPLPITKIKLSVGSLLCAS